MSTLFCSSLQGKGWSKVIRHCHRGAAFWVGWSNFWVIRKESMMSWSIQEHLCSPVPLINALFVALSTRDKRLPLSEKWNAQFLLCLTGCHLYGGGLSVRWPAHFYWGFNRLWHIQTFCQYGNEVVVITEQSLLWLLWSLTSWRVHRGLLASGGHYLAHAEQRPLPPGGPPQAELCLRIRRNFSLPGDTFRRPLPVGTLVRLWTTRCLPHFYMLPEAGTDFMVFYSFGSLASG